MLCRMLIIAQNQMDMVIEEFKPRSLGELDRDLLTAFEYADDAQNNRLPG